MWETQASVHPVVAWLIKSMFEQRALEGARLRSFSEQQFAKNYDASKLATQPLPQTDAPLVRRKFRYAGDAGQIATEESSVFACLLEFGDDTAASSAKFKSADKDGASHATTSIASLKKSLSFFSAASRLLSLSLSLSFERDFFLVI